MALLRADIDGLTALCNTLEDVAEQVDDIDVRTAAKDVAAVLPGTPLGGACELATEYTEGAWLRVSQRIGHVSTAVRQAAADLSATDEGFAADLDAFDFHIQGGRK
ncbi:hypothetical protein [Nocardia sp. CNY236]|uniref:hypothetical protein n=1 Tax=Nocardia sp. CNY236 TaxID=1169152 RepID=UPI00041A1154|nr:hypothetical protein [Nocardia sp. CNY236]